MPSRRLYEAHRGIFPLQGVCGHVGGEKRVRFGCGGPCLPCAMQERQRPVLTAIITQGTRKGVHDKCSPRLYRKSLLLFTDADGCNFCIPYFPPWEPGHLASPEQKWPILRPGLHGGDGLPTSLFGCEGQRCSRLLPVRLSPLVRPLVPLRLTAFAGDRSQMMQAVQRHGLPPQLAQHGATPLTIIHVPFSDSIQDATNPRSLALLLVLAVKRFLGA